MIISTFLALLFQIMFGLIIYNKYFSKKDPLESVVFSFGFSLGLLSIIIFISNQLFNINISSNFLFGLTFLYISISIFYLKEIYNPINFLQYNSISVPPKLFFSRDKTLFPLFAIITLFLSLSLYKLLFLPEVGIENVKFKAYFPRFVFENGTMPTTIGSFYDDFNAAPPLFFLQVSYLYIINGDSNIFLYHTKICRINFRIAFFEET